MELGVAFVTIAKDTSQDMVLGFRFICKLFWFDRSRCCDVLSVLLYKISAFEVVLEIYVIVQN